MSAANVGLVAGCVVAAILALAAMTRWVPQSWRDGGLPSVIDQFAGVNKTLFSFILALSLVSASASLSQAGTQVNAEAASLTNFYWATRPLAQGPREHLRELTREYTDTVISEEWPAMADGRTDTRAQELYDEMRRTLQDADKGTARENEFTRDALVSLRAVGDARRARVLSISQEIPSYLWFGLIGSAILVVLAAAVQIPRMSVPGVVSIGLLALLLSSVLTVLSALNHPFGGGIHVEPDSLRYALNRFAAI
ncbi:hypothetical protein Lfu02_62430 [Longispora fulva]|uniref:DUF4239 domain-containing protein n=1 Tax=Longispora fulva TaxID=619741 RepID=A0A8J7GF26_9ACTN|nr:DUF4239 domain-containing protein [Longispora fulva]MBG6134663.1 hypothetical protein [Longispora fulva]GIG61871.1 hypothetical protein Lfu02_62430 [Longispora fulva]